VFVVSSRPRGSVHTFALLFDTILFTSIILLESIQLVDPLITVTASKGYSTLLYCIRLNSILFYSALLFSRVLYRKRSSISVVLKLVVCFP
jgi:hypothetical protein